MRMQRASRNESVPHPPVKPRHGVAPCARHLRAGGQRIEPDEQRSRSRSQTQPDQWQSQILLRILKRASVIYVSAAEDALVRDLHMIPAHSIDEAIGIAKSILKKDDPTIVAIPDGIAVMVVDN